MKDNLESLVIRQLFSAADIFYWPVFNSFSFFCLPFVFRVCVFFSSALTLYVFFYNKKNIFLNSIVFNYLLIARDAICTVQWTWVEFTWERRPVPTQLVNAQSYESLNPSSSVRRLGKIEIGHRHHIAIFHVTVSQTLKCEYNRGKTNNDNSASRLRHARQRCVRRGLWSCVREAKSGHCRNMSRHTEKNMARITERAQEVGKYFDMAQCFMLLSGQDSRLQLNVSAVSTHVSRCRIGKTTKAKNHTEKKERNPYANIFANISNRFY